MLSILWTGDGEVEYEYRIDPVSGSYIVSRDDGIYQGEAYSPPGEEAARAVREIGGILRELRAAGLENAPVQVLPKRRTSRRLMSLSFPGEARRGKGSRHL